MRKFFVTIILAMILFPNAVNAWGVSDSYYVNNLGVNFTKEEYDLITLIYWDGYQDVMDTSEYNDFVSKKMLDRDNETFYLSNNYLKNVNMPLNALGRDLKVTKSCSSDCIITAITIWSTVPIVKGYDVIGARLENSRVSTIEKTKVVSSSTATYYNNIVKSSKGFGSSIMLPSNGTPYNVIQQFTVSKNGTVHVSYQHAGRTISLADSKKYTISPSGFGGVFSFYGAASGVYDNAAGISIAV